MEYKFKCVKCDKEYLIEMPISEYTSKGHFCECGEELQRDIKDFCTSSSRNVEGFFGVSKKT